MIAELLPLTKNKLRILQHIYEKKETHLLELSKTLKIHPYSVQKTLKSLRKLLEEKKVGRTTSLSLDFNSSKIFELLYFIEDYKVETKEKIRFIIKNLQIFFARDRNVLCCILFGSYAREVFTKESDIDLFFIVKEEKKEIAEKCTQLSSLFGKEINPIIMNEKEFKVTLKEKEPTLLSILEPKQRLLVVGKEFFLRIVY